MVEECRFIYNAAVLTVEMFNVNQNSNLFQNLTCLFTDKNKLENLSIAILGARLKPIRPKDYLFS
jgi:hypothetical protein